MVRCRPGTAAKLHVERRASARCQLPADRPTTDRRARWRPAKLTSDSYSTPPPRITRTSLAVAQLRRCNEQRRLADTGSPASDTVAPSRRPRRGRPRWPRPRARGRSAGWTSRSPPPSSPTTPITRAARPVTDGRRRFRARSWARTAQPPHESAPLLAGARHAADRVARNEHGVVRIRRRCDCATVRVRRHATVSRDLARRDEVSGHHLAARPASLQHHGRRVGGGGRWRWFDSSRSHHGSCATAISRRRCRCRCVGAGSLVVAEATASCGRTQATASSTSAVLNWVWCSSA